MTTTQTTATNKRPITPAGPDSGPVPPFPLRIRGPVIKGFGRGSKELNIPTANIPVEGLSVGGCETVDSGVYFGWASLDLDGFPSRDEKTNTDSDNHSDYNSLQQCPSNANDVVVDINREKNVESEAIAAPSAVAGVDLGRIGGQSQAHIYPMVMSIGWNPFYKNTVRSVEVHIMHQFNQDFYGFQMNLVILGYIRPELDYVSKEALIEDIKTDVEIARVSLKREAYGKYRFDGYLAEFGGAS